MSIFSAFFRTLAKQTFDYSSRTTRRWYYVFSAIILILYIVLLRSILMASIKFSDGMGGFSILDYVKIFLFIWCFLSWCAITVRRLHDANESGKLAWGVVNPLLIFKYMFALVRAGTKGDNRFGNDPRESSWMQ